jgi:hypothetical protein
MLPGYPDLGTSIRFVTEFRPERRRLVRAEEFGTVVSRPAQKPLETPNDLFAIQLSRGDRVFGVPRAAIDFA